MLMPPILKQAIISVSNKNGLISFAEQLAACDICIIATGGTAESLRKADLSVTEVSDYTGFPEIMQGRVKTLHPKIHGAVLARTGLDDTTLQQHAITPIDFVIANLYPFEQTIQQLDCRHEEAIEQIDIGGPTLIRAAAKNYERVTVVIDPDDYAHVIAELQQYGHTTLSTRRKLAAKAFAHTANYDRIIATYFNNWLNEHASTDSEFSHLRQQDNATGEKALRLPQHIILHYSKQHDLRYGENPHQAAALYTTTSLMPDYYPAKPQLLQGKALSFNNMIDSETAMQCAYSLPSTQSACVIVKHATPCGAALASSMTDAYQKAYHTDPTSAFGGIIAFNQRVDANTITAIFDQQFVEVIIAPEFTAEALVICQKKPNLRVLTCATSSPTALRQSFYSISVGLLVQETDHYVLQANDLKVVTQQSPTEAQWNDLLFAWQIARFAKSNAIVYAREQTTLGIGSGQTSRVFSAQIAIIKAEQANLSLNKAVMASDAFLPFADTVKVAAAAGISAIIQTGGSKRDQEVIAAANDAGIAMVFTGIRHFRH